MYQSRVQNEHTMSKEFTTTNPKFWNTRSQSGSILPIWHCWLHPAEQIRFWACKGIFANTISLSSHQHQISSMSFPSPGLAPVFATPSIPAFFTSNMNTCQHYCFPTAFNSQIQGRAICLFGRSLCISFFAYLANNVDTTLSNKKARMVWTMPQRQFPCR